MEFLLALILEAYGCREEQGAKLTKLEELLA